MISSTSTLLVAVSLFTAPAVGMGPSPGPASTGACAGKSEGDTCSFTYGGGPKSGQTFSGFCSGGACGAETQAENPHFSCPVVGETAYTGTDAYKTGKPSAAPLRGNVGCVDMDPLESRPKGKAGKTVVDASNIYGAMEAGFTKDQPGAECLAARNGLPDFELPGGVDTNLAEAIMHKACDDRGIAFSQALLDYCGGHADPFHYHERMNCLYTADSATGHSTRIGTAADGNGIYGHNIEGGCEPTDLDWCGGRTGVTPDSNGQEVYYYVVSNRAPFALGCFGPINTEAECRALYPECDGVAQSFTTAHGTDDYDLDCPCFDPVTGSNMPGQGKPNYLGPNGFDAYQLDLMEGDRACNDNDGDFASRPCTQAEKDAVSALYSSQKCSTTPTNTPSATPRYITPSSSPQSTTTPNLGDPRDYCGEGTNWNEAEHKCIATRDGIMSACKETRKEWAFTCDSLLTCTNAIDFSGPYVACIQSNCTEQALEHFSSNGDVNAFNAVSDPKWTENVEFVLNYLKGDAVGTDHIKCACDHCLDLFEGSWAVGQGVCQGLLDAGKP
jgi:hypothetical protein